MPMFIHEIEHIFDEYCYSPIFEKWKDKILDFKFNLYFHQATLSKYIEQFDVEDQSLIEFIYYYEMMNTVEERRKWPSMTF